MEQKKDWNSRVFESVAEAVDALVKSEHRGDKGTCVTAACLMFLTAAPATRRQFVDLVKLAEGRGYDGSVLDAAKRMIGADDPLGEVAEGLLERHGLPSPSKPRRSRDG